jgi:hypothetical protein
MKTLVFVAIMIVFVSVFSVGETVRIEAKASYFYPTDAAFREIYGQGLEYGGEISIKIIKSIEVWIGGSRYLRKGKLTLTREATEITISPLFVGLKFLSSGKSAKGYLALGIGKYSYKETNPLNMGIPGKSGDDSEALRTAHRRLFCRLYALRSHACGSEGESGRNPWRDRSGS